EITENALPQDPELAMQRISALRALGVRIAIDDFGMGYSSLALLSKMPFTRLKIDRSFVADSVASKDSMVIVDLIIDLAQNLNLCITAEGIETLDQAQMLAVKGADLGQGYFFSKPVDASDASELVNKTWHEMLSLQENSTDSILVRTRHH
ncbi:MAG: EAL domain-containing protein, partial [Oricola sp.]